MYDYELINTICIFVILIVNESYIFHVASNAHPHCAYTWNQSSTNTIGQEYIATTEMRYNTDIISYA